MIKKLIVAASIICMAAFSACSGGGAEELFKTAEFEELQNNKEHAEQLYRQIIEKHPDSTLAAKAKDKLEKLQK
ncbi:MAG: hypothetical protein ISR96_08640 [Nitrospira sp.]|nr:hypothetical protein [bacterium]MBL7049566.1 hypothetical protein [Nitrospira sp.]